MLLPNGFPVALWKPSEVHSFERVFNSFLLFSFITGQFHRRGLPEGVQRVRSSTRNRKALWNKQASSFEFKAHDDSRKITKKTTKICGAKPSEKTKKGLKFFLTYDKMNWFIKVGSWAAARSTECVPWIHMNTSSAYAVHPHLPMADGWRRRALAFTKRWQRASGISGHSGVGCP